MQIVAPPPLLAGTVYPDSSPSMLIGKHYRQIILLIVLNWCGVILPIKCRATQSPLWSEKIIFLIWSFLNKGAEIIVLCIS
jgi:hypothetical protein